MNAEFKENKSFSSSFWVFWFYSCCIHSSGAEGLRVEFDRQCSTERRHDPLTVMDGVNRIVSVRSGNEIRMWHFKLEKKFFVDEFHVEGM